MQTWMGREVRVNGTEDVPQEVKSPAQAFSQALLMEWHFLTVPQETQKRAPPQIHEHQHTGKGGFFETFADMDGFRRPQSSIITGKEPNSACPTQIDLVFHSVYGHNPHSYVMSNRSRLVAQELST